MENKPLYIPESKRWKGLTVYCNKCKTNVSDICKVSGKSIKQCENGDRHVFKIYVYLPTTGNQRKTKILETRDINEAVKQAIEFENEVKKNLFQNIDNKKIKSEIQSNTQPVLLVHAFAKYLSWLKNENVPAHLRKERSPEHIKDVTRALKSFSECLRDNGYNLATMIIEEINDNLVGKIYLYLKDKKFANRTFNKYLSYYTSFLKWYIEEYNFPIRNYFEKVKRKNLNPNPQSITKEEYEALLNIIKPEDGIKEYNDGVKPIRNIYRPWLADGFRLALETGRRREEVINLKWNNIKENSGIKYIQVEDYKVNRIQNRVTEEEKKYIYIPVTDSLEHLLNDLGYEKYNNTDCFILAPDIKISRGRIMSDVLSKGFSHYYNLLNTGRRLTFKCLRKTYITNLEIYMKGGNTKAITGHSDDGVIDRNYIDKKEIAKAAHGFSVFSEKETRTNELNEIRNNLINNQKSQKLEVQK